MDFDKDTWTVIDSYFRDNKNYRQNITSIVSTILSGKKYHLFSNNIIHKFMLKNLFQTDIYKYETHVYFGGEDGSEVFIGKPIIVNHLDDLK